MKQEILALLPEDHPWRDRIIYFDTIGSTNTHAKELAESGAPHGTVLIAGSQTSGRGRMGRSFHSPRDAGIYLSVILRPDCLPGELMHLTCAAGTAMCNAMEQAAGLRPGIKWINDLVIRSKKLGGILTELSICPQKGNVRYAIVGIGINCCQKQQQFPPELQNIATSLFLATGKEISRPKVAAAMIEALSQMAAKLHSRKTALMTAYRKDCVTLGKEVCVISPEGSRPGFAVDVDDNGELLVRFSDGSIQGVHAGEVSVRGMYGYV